MGTRDWESSGQQAHCRRVAAIAMEVGTRLGLPSNSVRIIEHTSLRHHASSLPLSESAFGRLMKDLFGPQWESLADAKGAEPTAAGKAGWVAQIVEVANLLDEHIEGMPYDDQPIDEFFEELSRMARGGLFEPAIVKALTGPPRASLDGLLAAAARLPVTPAVARRMLALTSDSEIDAARIEKLASTDAILAAQLLKVSNSSLFHNVKEIVTIRQAITHIGIDLAKKVLIAAAMQPLFASSRLDGLWKHSLEVAQTAEHLARLSGKADPEIAFLAGLLHDVGRLVVQRLGGEVAVSHARLLDRGADPVAAELLLFRIEHGRIGEELLRGWNFPDLLLEGIGRHHEPERSDSVLAALLYLAEFCCDAREAPPSVVRLKRATDAAGLTIERLLAVPPGAGSLKALAA
ncbi:MAG: HDOD domain-containing protein [Bryobacteraceae bacterium]